MNEFEEPMSDVQIDSDLYTTPLRGLALDVHEVYKELQAAGFEERALMQIVAHMLTYAVLYKDDYVIELTDEDDDEDEGDTIDGSDE